MCKNLSLVTQFGCGADSMNVQWDIKLLTKHY